MAICKILHMKDCTTAVHSRHLKRAIDYIKNGEKTQEQIKVGAVNCKPDNAYEQMISTKKHFDKLDGRQGYHIIISFKEGETDADTAYEITEQFVNEYLKDNYETVFAVHDNTDHIHAHIVFNSISFDYIGLNNIIKLWDKTKNSVNTVFQTKQISPYPSMPGITEAYLAIVPLKTFVENVLMDPENHLRIHIFEDNVRSFLGESNNVNKMIKETLESSARQERFGILNNGITIIASDVKVLNAKISIDNYQIVNGCQTSNVLFENYSLLRSNGMITVRVIEAHDLIAEVVKATNSQSKVEDTQFLSYEETVRRIEKYFDATEDLPGKEVKLYFERRLGQYKNASIPKNRIFSISDTFRAVGAMFLGKPEMAYRYPAKLIAEQYSRLLNIHNKEIVYYTATLALYRFKLLASNGHIEQKYVIHKWHILMILPYVGWRGKNIPSITNKKIESVCNSLISKCSKSDDECVELFKKATDVIKTVGLKTSRDEIRSVAYTQSIITYCNKYFR